MIRGLHGRLLAGFWLLPWLGERWSVAALSIPLFAIAALTAFKRPSEEVGLHSCQRARLKFALAAVAAFLLLAFSHDFETSFPVREVRRDYAATVIATGDGFKRQLVVNGVGMTSLTSITKVYGSPAPRSHVQGAAERTGNLLWNGNQLPLHALLGDSNYLGGFDSGRSVAFSGTSTPTRSKLMSSPLARVVIDDGRRFLDGSAQMYDVIVVDPPPPPQAAGSSLLYSREFYDVVMRHLRKGGIFQAWLPAMDCDAATVVSVTKALRQSFPYVRAFPSFNGYGIHFLASMEPIVVTASSVLAARMPLPRPPTSSNGDRKPMPSSSSMPSFRTNWRWTASSPGTLGYPQSWTTGRSMSTIGFATGSVPDR